MGKETDTKAARGGQGSEEKKREGKGQGWGGRVPISVIAPL